ncbi:MAG: LysR family transcriptional regulator, partial [Paracoccaceae bacterium]
MKSPDLTALRWFCLAIEAGNLTKAAAQAGVSVPTMSRSLKRLEAGLGFRLIHRSARTFRLTAEGERYFAQLSPVFDHLKEQVERLSEDSGELFGDIRMSCPESLVTSLVNDWVCDFME